MIEILMLLIAGVSVLVGYFIGKKKDFVIASYGDLEKHDGLVVVDSSSYAFLLKAACDAWEWFECRNRGAEAKRVQLKLEKAFDMIGNEKN